MFSDDIAAKEAWRDGGAIQNSANRAGAAGCSGLARRVFVADGWRVTEESPSRRDRRVVLLLWLLPLWLLVSSVAGLWLYFRNKEANEEARQMRFATGIAAEGLADDVAKLLGFVGERHGDDELGARGLDRAVAMIEGSLGPSNAGYRVERLAGPALPTGRWPILIAKVRGKDEDAPGLWVIAGYDSRPGSPGAEANASGVASALAAAHAMAADFPERPVFFAFIPHARRGDAAKREVLDLLRDRAEPLDAMIVVESTGAAPSLQVASGEAGRAAMARLDGLAGVVPGQAMPAADPGIFPVLLERGLPALRVATRPAVGAEEADDRAPDPAAHAAATAVLVELIRRLSDS